MRAAQPDLVSRLATLVSRERRTRFAGGALSQFWAFLTPLSWIAFVVIIFRILNRSPAIYVPPEIFVATGVLPYIVFRQTIASISRTPAAHRYMKYISGIKDADLITATALTELVNALVIATVLFVAISIAFFVPVPNNPAGVLIALTVGWFLATGIGRFIAVVGMLSDSFARSVPILLRPVFWLSGIFYTATELPGAAQELLWFSPTLHVTELLRESYFIGYTSPISTMLYPVLFGATFFLISYPIEWHIIRNRLSKERL
ncbi:ABC transporter permease [Sulfitobacter pacificus]|uniref:ABC transporter permease n=1 Tax=Sulfitobacter pacificus TaxID=1499314 RepID=UPI0036182E69